MNEQVTLNQILDYIFLLKFSLKKKNPIDSLVVQPQLKRASFKIIMGKVNEIVRIFPQIEL